MNVFYLSHCPIQCAQWMHDRHVVKMILETAQLLSTAYVVIDGNQVAYKPTHSDHPSLLWAIESRANYEWLYRHFVALIDEHQHRYPKSSIHKSARYCGVLKVPPKGLKGTRRTPIKLAIPLPLRLMYSGTEAYIEYYRQYKRVDKDGREARWTNRQPPEWFNLNQ